MKKFFKILSGVLSLCFCLVLGLGFFIKNNFPDSFSITNSTGVKLNDYLPITAKALVGDEYKERNYNATLMLMNSIPVKGINLRLIEETKVVPCGTPFGIKLFTEGVAIVGISDVKTANGTFNPAKISGLKKGDVILTINEKPINTNKDMAQIIENCCGKELILNIRRNNNDFIAKLIPIKSDQDNLYKAGMWVRDSSAGIGTMTFYNPKTNVFAGLGHGICDVDTGELLPLSHGDVVSAKIDGIKLGQKGSPGELKGFFNNYQPIGNLVINTASGIYGNIYDMKPTQDEVVIAMKQQVKTGKAHIITTLSQDTCEMFEININSVNYDESSPTKNMVIEITDRNLISKTGGIVQGMSGSPIIQNGRLVGAVTHVFVNYPKKGYGIFAENMLTNSLNVQRQSQKSAS